MKKRLLSRSLASLLLGIIMNTSHAQWSLTGNTVTGTSFLGTTNNFSLRLKTNNLQRMIVDSLGRVGIGIVAPKQLLTVQSSGTVPAATWITSGAPVFAGYGEGTPGNADFNLLMASSTAVNARGVIGMKRSRGTLAAPTAVINNDQLGSMLVSGYDGTAFQGSAAVDFFADGTPTAGNVPTRISFVTGTNSSTRAERLKIGNTGDITMNNNQFFLQKSTGNLGIGTSTPTENLVVSEPAGATSGTQNFVAVETVINPLVPSTQGVIIRKDDGVKRGFKLYQDGSDDGNSVLKIASFNGGADVDRLTIRRDNGYVGIGTTTPTTPLYVKSSNNYLAHFDGGDNLYIAFSENGAYRGYLGSYAGNPEDVDFGTGASTSGKLHLTIGAVPKLTIDNTGNVGIGTTAPAQKLDVRGGSTDDAAIISLGNADNSHRMLLFPGRLNDPNPFIGWTPGDPLRFATVGSGFSEQMRINSNGNVGIGTTTPSKKLEVAGVGGLKVSTADLVGSSTDWIAGNFGSANVDSDRVVIGNLDGRATIGSHNGALNAWKDLVINRDGGNVGIGVFQPTTKLDVNGLTHLLSTSTGGGTFEGSNLQVDGSASSSNFPCIAFKGAFNNTFTQLYSLGSSGGFLAFTHQGGPAAYVPIAASAFNVNSDITLKKDITHVNTIEAYEQYLAQIRNIDAITYRYKDESANPDAPSPSGKVRVEAHVGFSAQSLPAAIQTKLPVDTKPGAEMKLGYNLSDMAGLTLIGIKALDAKTASIAQQNEELKKTNAALQSDVETLKAQMKDMMTQFTSLKQSQQECCTAAQSKMTNQNETLNGNKASSLEQNAPNPFNSNTVIKYHLTKNTNNAVLNITDARGSVIKSIALSAKENGQVTMSAGTLSAGTYFYSLIIDGRKVATREMQIVR